MVTTSLGSGLGRVPAGAGEAEGAAPDDDAPSPTGDGR